jgi:hypothetical protein
VNIHKELKNVWLAIFLAFVLISLGFFLDVVQGHPHTEPDRREIRVHHIRGTGEWGKTGLYHLPDFGVCYVYQWQGLGNGGPFAVPVPCPWEKK